jgi:membrane-bound lytic murein transglycosylase MltF
VVAQELAAAAPAKKPAQSSEAFRLSLADKPWTGDFDAMLQRRMIRFLAPYSRTLYFVDKGRERGLAAALARDFEHYVNTKYAVQLNKRPLTVYLIPTTLDKLLTNLNAGLGDISAGNLTATEERLKIVDFIAPHDRKPVRELVITGPQSPALASLDDLAGKEVYVRQSSSYNAGPANIAKMRQLAAQRGLDPNKWFNNVEIVVAEKIGIETTTYVRNIYKYYAAYRLIVDAQAAREKALQSVQKPS